MHARPRCDPSTRPGGRVCLSAPSFFFGSHVSISQLTQGLWPRLGGGLRGPGETLIQPDRTAATALQFGPAVPIPQRGAAVPRRLVRAPSIPGSQQPDNRRQVPRSDRVAQRWAEPCRPAGCPGPSRGDRNTERREAEVGGGGGVSVARSPAKAGQKPMGACGPPGIPRQQPMTSPCSLPRPPHSAQLDHWSQQDGGAQRRCREPGGRGPGYGPPTPPG